MFIINIDVHLKNHFILDLNCDRVVEIERNQATTDNKEILYNKTSSSNPINNNGIIARINSLNTRTTFNKTYGGYNQNPRTTFSAVDYPELLQSLSEVLKNKNNINDFFCSIHNIFTNKLNASFVALGVYQPQPNYINLKLVDKIGGAYSSRIFSSEENHPLMECYQNMCSSIKSDSKFLNVPYLPSTPVAILPLISVNNCLGVLVVGDYNAKHNLDLYALMTNYMALFMHNAD